MFYSSRFRSLTRFAALAFAAPFVETPHHQLRGSHIYNRHGWGSQPVPGGGAGERARRLRQILAGSLKAENGLISWEECAARGWHDLIPADVRATMSRAA